MKPRVSPDIHLDVDKAASCHGKASHTSFSYLLLSPHSHGRAALFTRSVTPPSDPVGTHGGPVSHRQVWPPSSVAAPPQPELSDPAQSLPPNSPESGSS